MSRTGIFIYLRTEVTRMMGPPWLRFRASKKPIQWCSPATLFMYCPEHMRDTQITIPFDLLRADRHQLAFDGSRTASGRLESLGMSIVPMGWAGALLSQGVMSIWLGLM